MPHAHHYVDLDRAAWAALRDGQSAGLDASRVQALAGLGDVVDPREVEEVYAPLARLLLLQDAARSHAREATAAFLGAPARRSPFVVAVAGSVAVGKSTTARLLRELLSAGGRRVDLVPTDGFLHPNAELERRGLMARKGWPESYDTRALLDFLAAVRAGEPHVQAPVYSHVAYDVLPGERQVVDRPDVLVVEGLTLLQPASPARDGRPRVVASDYFDTSVYVDAAEEHLLAWYVARFLALRDTAFRRPGSYFTRYAALSDEEARETASAIWHRTNGPNLRRNVLPTRGRAAVVLEKDAGHRTRRVRLRLP
ncbi:type I pantothenate kinase [Vallicoccus soli]|uniref:Pantothenate kinase n=1 Tax=Vallicoccus soli TaxID=2339232 RepID=A0A3A3Z9S2_9ACTN|nr:type I pantothenate kinase [Vallicoccus soli]RJK97836.1 type I pantothenate kinase [Vallicoccus soli]